MIASTSARLAIALAALTLGACQQTSNNHAATEPPASPVIAAPATTPSVSAPAAASTAPLPGDHATTAHYRIAITLPTLPASDRPLANALRTTADEAKRQFLAALPDPEQSPELADRQFEMILDFKVAATTSAFTSVRETGMQDTGGAHPIPVEAAFVYDRTRNRQITLDDLFTQPDTARTALAKFAHDTLLKKLLADAPKPSEGSPEAIREWKANTLQMLDGGTKPTSVNFSLFVVRAGATPTAASPGLTLIFPPYQVAPYAAGTQMVDVPAGVFAAYLKPAYRSDFAAP